MTVLNKGLYKVAKVDFLALYIANKDHNLNLYFQITPNLPSCDIHKQFYGNRKGKQRKNCDFEKIHLNVAKLAF